MVLSNERLESLLELSSSPSHTNTLCYPPQCTRLQQGKFLPVLWSYQQYFSEEKIKTCVVHNLYLCFTVRLWRLIPGQSPALRYSAKDMSCAQPLCLQQGCGGRGLDGECIWSVCASEPSGGRGLVQMDAVGKAPTIP